MTALRDSFSIAVLFAIGVWSVAFVGARSAAQNNDGAVLKKKVQPMLIWKMLHKKQEKGKTRLKATPRQYLREENFLTNTVRGVTGRKRGARGMARVC
jgi:hypothetical protein